MEMARDRRRVRERERETEREGELLERHNEGYYNEIMLLAYRGRDLLKRRDLSRKECE